MKLATTSVETKKCPWRGVIAICRGKGDGEGFIAVHPHRSSSMSKRKRGDTHVIFLPSLSFILCGGAPGCRAGRLDSSSLSSNGWGSWCLGCPAGRSSRSPGWCAPAPPASGLAPAPLLKWRRSCSKSSRTCGACGQTGLKWCPNRHRCRCCRCHSPAPEEASSWRSVCSQFGRTPLAPGPAGSRQVQCTLQRQNTEQPAQGFLKGERKWLSRTSLKRTKYTQVPCAHTSHGLWRGRVSNGYFYFRALLCLFPPGKSGRGI